MLGAERKIVLSEEDRRRIAYHEGGHAIVGMLTPGADPVRKVSIIPRGMALGVTLSTPDDDRFNLSEEELRAKIRVALGGRVAEEVVFGDITTGAESDIQQVTRIARGMVARWGMSEKVGFITVAPQEGQNLLLPGAEPVSEATQELVDAEVRRIVDEEHEATRAAADRQPRAARRARRRPCSSARRSTSSTPTPPRASTRDRALAHAYARSVASSSGSVASSSATSATASTSSAVASRARSPPRRR